MNQTILVQKNSNGKTKFIALTLDGTTVHREWGLINGKTQTTSNTYNYINKGKANELSPTEAALDDYYRIIEKKTKEGYIVTPSLDILPDLENNNMDFNNLPVQFCCSKPHTSIPKVKLNKLIKESKVKFFIKENGLCHFILITDNKEVKIYTRRIDDHTTKYPKIVEAVKVIDYPANTLLIVELVIDPALNLPHMESFNLMSSISRSDTLEGKVKEDVTQTLYLQELHPVKAVVFNVLFHDKQDLTSLHYDDILNLYINYFDDYRLELFDAPKQTILIRPFELFFKSYDEAFSWADKNKKQYEGLVVWDISENAEITYNGKPNRRACYKLKASQEDDVVAYDWKEGTGVKQGKIGSLLIGKYSKDGVMIPMGNVGSGLKIKEGDCEIENWTFPCVIEITYDQKFPTGKYQFPRFNKKHEDKLPLDIRIED